MSNTDNALAALRADLDGCEQTARDTLDAAKVEPIASIVGKDKELDEALAMSRVVLGTRALLEALDEKSVKIIGQARRISELEAELAPHRAAEQERSDRRERERLRVAALSEHGLHREQRHPDYEYATTENARKSGDSPMPPGDGWEENDIVACHEYREGEVVAERWRNWERGDFSETNYWRRRKPEVQS